MNPKINLLLISVILFWSCQPGSDNQEAAWPTADELDLTWEVINDASPGNATRTAVFTLSNKSDVAFPNTGWKLFYSQFPNAISTLGEDAQLYAIQNQGGDLYSIHPMDSFPGIPAGGSFQFRYRAPYPFVKASHGPQGPYLVMNGNESHTSVLHHYTIKPFPTDFTFENVNGPKSIFINPADRFEANQSVRNQKIEDLIPIIPTPYESKMTGSYYEIASSVNIRFEKGLEKEADHLSGFLNEVLQANVSSSSEASSFHISLSISPSSVPGRNQSTYQLTIDQKDGISIAGSDAAGVFYGIQSLKALIPPSNLAVPSERVLFPTVSIKDAPRFDYRGLMLDIARNFQTVDQLKKVISLISFYKMNKLHLHLTDDEGWRLEIPDLPSLTEVGSIRNSSYGNGKSLPPAYGSGAAQNSGSSFLTRKEFIDLLRYATDHHVQVIPEINGPGHARAAIKAMQYRYDSLMTQGQEVEARKYLLHDPNDASEYSSAQNYHDNVMCVCQEFTYSFIEKVVSEVVKMYAEADAPLSLIHTGGDEVPVGSWTASPECERLIKDEASLTSVHDLFPYFVARYAAIASKHGIRIAGWEEIVMKANETNPSGKHVPNPDLLGVRPIPFVWNSAIGGGSEDVIYQLANLGYEVIMCNASNLYLDMATNYEPEEPGLYWAGYVDTKNAFELTPFDLFRTVMADELGNLLDGIDQSKKSVSLLPEAEENILGIQGQLWSETVKGSNKLEYMLLPKLLGVAERAWSKPPSWVNAYDRTSVRELLETEWQAFANRIGKIELPRLDYLEGGFHYRLPPPGARIENGLLEANTSFPGLQIRYTTDGSDPNEQSQLYVEPLEVSTSNLIKLRTFSTTDRASRISELQGQPVK